MNCWCTKCRHPFTVDLSLPALVSVAVKRIKAIVCPACGAPNRFINLGSPPPSPEQRQEAARDFARDRTGGPGGQWEE